MIVAVLLDCAAVFAFGLDCFVFGVEIFAVFAFLVAGATLVDAVTVLPDFLAAIETTFRLLALPGVGSDVQLQLEPMSTQA